MRAVSMAIAWAICCSLLAMGVINALESKSLQGLASQSSQKAEVTIGEALAKQSSQSQQQEKRAAHERMKNKAIKSLE